MTIIQSANHLNQEIFISNIIQTTGRNLQATEQAGITKQRANRTSNEHGAWVLYSSQRTLTLFTGVVTLSYQHNRIPQLRQT